ncbi:MAG: 3-deoxy-8-phosphooctulonate synthase [Vampirovibrionales bacterium]|jgi:2-dehydro-3-deoxyphosphooctonate aldolase (KDO 8-P synthase)|nr:3-deoxy-8-phosphooctulonate synthase [Vampirovibrionales bacterium]
MSSPKPFTVIAGPCILEGENGEMNLNVAKRLKTIMASYGNEVDFYFKSSYDKANRTSNSSYRGYGVREGLDILKAIKDEVGVPICTDVHSPEQAILAAEVVDFLQIPAFLCRQTDLLVAAGETGKRINIKKGQFLSPQETQFCAEKVFATGNQDLFICERGTTFGYNNLVVDMRCFPIVKSLGLRTIFDATHSVQQPGGLNGKTGGNREFAPVLARSAVAAGVEGLFFETHPNPNEALSDGPNQIPVEWVEPMMDQLLEMRQVLAKYPDFTLVNA